VGLAGQRGGPDRYWSAHCRIQRLQLWRPGSSVLFHRVQWRYLRWIPIDNGVATQLDTWNQASGGFTYSLSVATGTTDATTRACWSVADTIRTAALGAAPSAAVTVTCPVVQVQAAGNSCFFLEACNGNLELHALLSPNYFDTDLESGAGTIIGDYPDAARILYLHKDGTAWSVAYNGTAKKQVTSMPLPVGMYSAQSQWLFYYDFQAQMTRVSRIDGTVIDEPLTATDVLYNGYILLSPDKANLWMGGAWGDANNRINYCPVSRLP